MELCGFMGEIYGFIRIHGRFKRIYMDLWVDGGVLRAFQDVISLEAGLLFVKQLYLQNIFSELLSRYICQRKAWVPNASSLQRKNERHQKHPIKNHRCNHANIILKLNSWNYPQNQENNKQKLQITT